MSFSWLQLCRLSCLGQWLIFTCSLLIEVFPAHKASPFYNEQWILLNKWCKRVSGQSMANTRSSSDHAHLGKSGLHLGLTQLYVWSHCAYFQMKKAVKVTQLGGWTRTRVVNSACALFTPRFNWVSIPNSPALSFNSPTIATIFQYNFPNALR